VIGLCFDIDNMSVMLVTILEQRWKINSHACSHSF
jgi:hypothetical protein